MRTSAVWFLVCAMLASAVHAAEAGPKKQAVDIRTSEADALADRPAVPVEVVNFPAVQTVGGTVDVGNLPLDPDGALRVTSAPSVPATQARYVALFDGDITLQPYTTGFVTDSVDTAGYSRVGFLLDGQTQTGFVEWSWGSSPERFGPVTDLRNGAGTYGNATEGCKTMSSERVICVVSGDRVRIRVDNPWGAPAHITAVGVYLIP